MPKATFLPSTSMKLSVSFGAVKRVWIHPISNEVVSETDKNRILKHKRGQRVQSHAQKDSVLTKCCVASKKRTKTDVN